MAKALGDSGRDHVDLRHRNADFLREAFDGGVSARELLARDGLRAISGQRDLVGIKVQTKFMTAAKASAKNIPFWPPEVATEEHQQQTSSRSAERGLEHVSHRFVERYFVERDS